MFSDLISFYLKRHSGTESCTLDVLVIADENFSTSDLASFSIFKSVVFITNRWDIHNSIQAFSNSNADQSKIQSQFNDFDLSQFESVFDLCLYRISKERTVCHRVFNQLHSVLKSDGLFCVCGRKTEGIRGYHKKLANLYQDSSGIVKDGDQYYYSLTNSQKPIHSENLLDDKQYTELRELEINGFRFKTKPGQYGWNKVDAGSKFLMDTLLERPTFNFSVPIKILDLGCGYGYLSMRMLNATPENSARISICTTDNNAAAIDTCKANLAIYNETADIQTITSNCADTIEESFDIILCNPPFHQGFENDRSLTHSFLKGASNHLKPNGNAYFVVNSFIPLERLATDYFKYCSQLSNNKQFAIYKAGK